jgi:putative redox protein
LSNIIATATAVNKGEKYTTALLSGKHSLISDEPLTSNGTDAGPAPGDFLCMSLASCTAITLRMYAERKGWQVPEISVTANLVKGAEMASGNNTFYCEVKWKGNLSPEQEKRFLEIAKACPIHRLLTKPSDVITITG